MIMFGVLTAAKMDSECQSVNCIPHIAQWKCYGVNVLYMYIIFCKKLNSLLSKVTKSKDIVLKWYFCNRKKSQIQILSKSLLVVDVKWAIQKNKERIKLCMYVCTVYCVSVPFFLVRLPVK